MARGWLDHPIFDGRPYCQRAAWAWLIEEASYAGRRRSIKGRTVELKRGQLTASIRFIAKAWRWNRSAVERFLARLKTETMIKTATETGQLVITICNYERYQTRAAIDETATETPVGTEARQERDKLERKKRKESLSDDSPEAARQFETFWQAYPSRSPHANPRKPARSKFLALLAAGTPAEAIIAGARNYAASVELAGTEPKFVTQAITWLNQERWNDSPPADAGRRQFVQMGL